MKAIFPISDGSGFEQRRGVVSSPAPRGQPVAGETPKQLAERLALIRAIYEIAPQLRTRKHKDAQDVATILDFLRARLIAKSSRQ